MERCLAFRWVNSILGEFPAYAVEVRAGKEASPDAAVAAHFAVVQFYRAQTTTLDAAYAASLASIPDGG